MPIDPEYLKERLIFEKDLSKLWNLFMDATEENGYIRNGRPAQDIHVYKEIRGTSKQVIAQIPGVKFVSLDLFEAIPGELFHGPLVVSTGMANVFYFKSINAGLFAIPRLPLPATEWVFARFSVADLKAASAAVQ